MGHTSRRVSYVFLWMVPVLAIGFAAVRALRVPGVYHSIGGMLFAAIAIAAWILGARAIRGGVEGQQRLALAGGLLLIPFALIALFWVGLGPPWGSTPAENVMRYQVLLVSSIAVTIGLSFPDPTALSTPWYTQPGFVAGIPAIPFIMPFLLGVLLLRRAGDE